MANDGSVEPFGRLEDGLEIKRITIERDGLKAKILTFGAIVQDLRLDDLPFPLVLGFEKLDSYLTVSPFCGAIAGRFANRIENGSFMLDDETHQLSVDPANGHHLHGGSASFGKRPWELASFSDDRVSLKLHSEDGEAGYPGNLDVECIYEIKPGQILSVKLTAKTDTPTIVNLAHHSYFNLDGSTDIGTHQLTIAADAYLPVRSDLIPTGEIKPVAGTPYDFRQGRHIFTEMDGGRVCYDENFVLADHRRAEPEFAAKVAGSGGVTMTLYSTEPGVQFYDGAKVDVPDLGLDGRTYGAFSGLCLEPQLFPDSPNQAGFTDATLRPGEIYRQVSEFRFAR